MFTSDGISTDGISTDGISTNGISTSASICRRIELGYVGPGKRYSSPFTSNATVAIATATAIVRA